MNEEHGSPPEISVEIKLNQAAVDAIVQASIGTASKRDGQDSASRKTTISVPAKVTAHIVATKREERTASNPHQGT